MQKTDIVFATEGYISKENALTLSYTIYLKYNRVGKVDDDNFCKYKTISLLNIKF